MGESDRATAKEFPKVKLQISSEDWLKEYGLSAKNLTLDQILPTLGFHQSTDYVKPLQRNVTSQYADGLFIQHQDSTGKIFNLCNATSSSLATIEDDLQDNLVRLKSRRDWLQSESRSTFGVLYERKVVIVADTCAREEAQLKPFLEVLTSAIQEQVIHMDQFNLIRCTEGMQKWKEELTDCTEENITEAIQWIKQTEPQSTPFKTNVIEGLVVALAHSDAEAIYVFVNKEDTLRAFDIFLEKVTPSLIPVNIVSYNCESLEAVNQYKTLAAASGGRLFTSHIPPSQDRKNLLLSSYSSLNSVKSQSAVSQSTGNYSLTLTSGKTTPVNIKSRPQSAASAISAHPPSPQFVSNDMLLILEEIELTRNTLAEIQALRLEVGHATGEIPYSVPQEEEVDYDSLTSRQWLDINGLKAKKLLYEDLAHSLAFHHCNGVVQIPVPRYKHEIKAVEMVPHTRVVHAQYCKEFVHVRLNGKDTFHVQMAPRKHKIYEQKVEDLCKGCLERLAWLRNGSRELFGTLLENKVVVAIDTSSSLKERLSLIKNKVQQLLKEQLSQKKEFTIIHFNSAVYAWRTGLVPTSQQNLEAVGQWVDGLCADGTTNTQKALEVAMSVLEAEGVYLLTDGRPDQPTEQILARVQQLPKIPVHTISFNCADSNANAFLAQLAKNTGGRYYYYSEDTADPEGPKSYQSEDMQLLEDELELAVEQLHLASHLLTECVLARKRRKYRSDLEKPNAGSSVPQRKSKLFGKERKGRLMASKKWLERNSLNALGLNLVDAMGSSNNARNHKYAPSLSKSMTSIAINTLFPLAHVTSNNKTTLIHPSGTDISDYEQKLDKHMEVVHARLACLAWESIAEKIKSDLALELGIEERQLPSADTYIQHREKLRAAVEKSGWPHPQEDFDLLEDQIKLANNFQTYLNALKAEVQRRNARKMPNSTGEMSSDEEEQEVKGLVNITSLSSSLGPLLKVLSPTSPSGSPQHYILRTHGSEQSPRSIMSRYSKGQQVVVRYMDDGFYYPGVVRQIYGPKEVQVELIDKKLLTADHKDIMFIGGAEPCPTLILEDTVLVRVRIHHGPHSNPTSGSCDYYIPGIIRSLPEDSRKGRVSYSVVVFNRKVVSCPRRGIIKISEPKYVEVSKHIKEMMSQSQHGSDSYSSHSSSTTTLSQTSLRTKSQSSTRSSSCSSIRNASHPSIRNSSHSSISSSRSEHRSHRPTSTNSNHDGTRDISQRSKSSISASHKPKAHSTRHKKQSQLESKSGLLELNKVQEALLEQQSRELSAMQITNATLERELMTRIENRKLEMPTSPQRSDTSSNNKGFPNKESPSANEGGGGETSAPMFTTSASWIAAYLPPVAVTNNELSSIGLPQQNNNYLRVSEQAVNTDVWTEDKGVGTGPLMESRAVETEWTESGLESSTDSEAPPVHESPPQNTSLKAPSTITLQDNQASETLNYDETDSKDPLVQEHVLARWPDDGWYYRGIIKQALGDMSYEVVDACQDSEAIHARDIIIDALDANRKLEVGHTVAALHPNYSCSYAPGVVRGILNNDLHFTVELHDGTTVLLLRHDLYYLELAKYKSDVEYLQQRETAWVGRAVIARRDRDGFYLPGKVEKHIGSSHYLIKRADDTTENQDIIHLFGELTKKRSFRKGDHALALAIPGKGICMPATIKGRVNDKLQVEFCDGQVSLVNPLQCFWLSSEYFQEAAEFLAMNVPSTSTLHSSSLQGYYASESDKPTSEYSAAASNT